MTNCFQFEKQNILQHGISVWNNTNKILSNNFDNLKLPEWFINNHSLILSLIPREKYQQIKEYNILHDCGKPLCIKYDENGKKHFPNHAEISYNTYLKYYKDNYVADLIRYDMIMHTESYDNIILKQLSIDKLTILYITALSEINSNAQMFGGIESINFKIKFKRLNKLGKKLFKIY